MSSMRLRFAAVLLTGALAATALTGCATEQQTPEENVTAACKALEDLRDAFAAASTELQDATSMGDVRAIRDDVLTAYDEVQTALDAVADDRAADLADAVTSFGEATEAIGDDESLTDARASLVEETKALADAHAAAESGLSCE